MPDETELTPTEVTIRTRRSVRLYRDDPVPRELIERVLDSARWAPSAVNSQPWHFIVVQDSQRRSALAKTTGFAGVVSQGHVAKAPVLVALCGDERRSAWYVHDCCLASQNLMLAAAALGLGTCWIGAFDEERAAEVLGVPDKIRVVGLITIGYPRRSDRHPTPRVSLASVVHWEKFGPPESWTQSIRRRGQSGRVSLWRKIGDFLGFRRRGR
ncbi:MAG TPA: nitroreductase family protein [Anaerolineae bacterium]|nr:nitroreductase family protein [Anaerolineae bacterium]